MATVIDLTGLGGNDGFVIRGDATIDFVGYSVASAGDINGDGIDDLIVGTPYGSNGGSFAGEVYVIFGKLGASRSDIDLTSLAAADGFIIQGGASTDSAGSSVAPAGDVNDDGIDDLIIGAPGGGNSAGQAYVIFGSNSATRSNIDLASLAAADGFGITGGAARDYAGNSVASAGDINGDGIDDLIIGARGSDAGGNGAGAAYVVYGQAGATRIDIDLASLTAAEGFIIQGDAPNDSAGRSVASAGDINGDDIDDLIIGAPDGDNGGNGAGEAYVIFGKAGANRANIDLGSLAAADGFVIQGDGAGDASGFSVASAGDINGDGIDDLIIGAYGSSSGGDRAGEAYVIFGKAGATRSDIDLTSLAASNGFSITGGATNDLAGFSVASAGDIDGDGIDDLIIGAPAGDNGGIDAGQAYVIFGKLGTTRGSIDLSSLDSADGFIIQGDAAGDYASSSVAAAGDINGDGIDDLIVGAPLGDDGGTDAGEAYVIFGSAELSPDKPPVVANPIANQSSLEDAPVSFTIPADAFLDPDGDPLTYTAQLADDSPLPAWLAFNAATRSFSGTPPLDFAGSLNLRVTAIANGLSASDDFTLTIVPEPATRIFIGTTLADVFTATNNDNWIVDGRAGNDTLTTLDGNDLFIASIGNDIVSAGGGDDVITFSGGVNSNGFDVVDGGTGFDELRALSNGTLISLAAVTGIELVSAAGLTGVSIIGNSAANVLDFSGASLLGITAIRGGGGADTIIGSAGDDTIVGEAGNDVLAGGNGNDSFLVSGDVRADSFDGGTGTDTIRATAANTRIGTASVTGMEVIDGGGFANVGLFGTTGGDLIDLSGLTLTGIAFIDGGAGIDSITGSAGADRIEGGSGADILAGGTGADTFDYDIATQSNLANTDLIIDFEVGIDLIDLAGIDANTKIAGNDSFAFIADAAFSKTAGELRIDTSGAGLTTLQGDTNGDGKADLVIQLQGDLTLGAIDFLL